MPSHPGEPGRQAVLPRKKGPTGPASAQAGQPRVTTARRIEIADAALSIIGTRGIADLTMANLAAKLGVTSGALFRHFKTRDEILEEVACRVVDLVEATFPDPRLPPLERLRRLFEARATTLGQHAGIARLVFSEQFAKAVPPQAATQLSGVVARTRRFLLDILEEAAKAGLVRDDIPCRDLLIPVLGTLMTLVYASSQPRTDELSSRPDPARAVNVLLALIKPAGQEL